MRLALRHILLLAVFAIALLTAAQHGGDPDAHTRIADHHYQRMAYAPAAMEYRLRPSSGGPMNTLPSGWPIAT